MPTTEVPAVIRPCALTCTPPAIPTPPPRFAAAAVEYTRRSDGAVLATCHGATGAGWSEEDALMDLGYNLLAGLTPIG